MDPSLISVRSEGVVQPLSSLPTAIQINQNMTASSGGSERVVVPPVGVGTDHRHKQLPLKKRKNVLDESNTASSSNKKEKNKGTSVSKSVLETETSMRRPLVVTKVNNSSSNNTAKKNNSSTTKKKKKKEEEKPLQASVITPQESGSTKHAVTPKSNKHSTNKEAVAIDLTSEGTTPPLKQQQQEQQKQQQSQKQQQQPKTKKKKKKLTFEGQILRILFQTCKPYNVKGLMEILECASPSALEYALMSLLDKKLVFKKEFPAKKEGREPKVLYWGNLDMQHHKDAILCLGENCTEQELTSAEDDNKLLTRKLYALGQTIHILENQPTTSNLETQVKTIEVELKTLESRIQEAKDYKQQLMSKSNKTKNKTTNNHNSNPNKLKKCINYHRDEWRTRKEKTVDFVENMADAMEKKVKSVYDMLDIETDEMVSVQMPKKYNVS